MTIPTHLIEKALALTGRMIEDMNEIRQGFVIGHFFSIEKFGWYLFSPEFIDRYSQYLEKVDIPFLPNDIGRAIYEYQRRDKEFPEGNPANLISLLEKI